MKNLLMENLQKQCLNCSRCLLRDNVIQVVFGEGDLSASLMLIGEAPGKDEDRLGRPFVGRAGELLNKIMLACGLKREDVFISNIIKCRPPNNRIPTWDEINQCLPWLQKQIGIINLKIIICLGATSAKTLIDPDFKITKQRGQWYEYQGIPVMPTFHPAALLRDANKKRPVWEDFKKVMTLIKK